MLGRYSMDWHDPDFRTDRHDAFLGRMKGPLRERFGNYGTIDPLWFDHDGREAACDQAELNQVPDSSNLVLLTGATGYVGGRLLPKLLEAGWRVRCLARKPDHLLSRVPAGVEVVAGDLLDAASLSSAMSGAQAAFYLVHSMSATGDFEAQDRLAADNFSAVARAAGVQRIIYLGGLGEDGPELSAHLRSRHEVGERLRAHGVPVIEFRASIIIGSGSLSFEMIRALVERLPVMLTPRWVNVAAQPIAIGDVLAYLREALTLKTAGHAIFEIGGPDRVSYGDLMREYARQRGLRRLMIPVPFLTPRLSSLWLGLVTPLFARVGRKLIDSIRHPTVVRDSGAATTFSIRPIPTLEAIAGALRNEDSQLAQTRWSDALSSAGAPRQWGGTRFGNRLVDSRSLRVSAAVPRVFAMVERIGGEAGWHYANWLWAARGWLDLLAGGVGMRRGRRDPARLHVGDVVDCWRVEAIEPDRRLRLQAEMKLPGRAWLDFEVRPDGEHARLTQTATFDPVGLWGLAYWYGVWPLHQLVFAGMLGGLARAAERSE
ncbi:MAG TPA: SDR family oxidoreductase [Candidatus Paceibacterota bacterium]|nr:SDR family oxidoreductase [Candidatus Paceibacterota bacterium]